MKRSWVIFIILCWSCEAFDRPEKIPSFIHVDEFDFDITHSSQGSASEKITDVWVYVDGSIAGVYELPSTIPLHFEGNHALKLHPGIKQNGISVDRTKYPFYKPYIVDVNLIPDSIIPLYPETEYEEQLYIWLEDFEDPQSKFETFIISDTDLVIIDQPADIYLMVLT